MCAAVDDDLLQGGDARCVQVRVAEQCGEQSAPGVVGVRHRVRDQHRALALAEVVTDRLAGQLGVAEDPQQVVAELEGTTQRGSVRGQRGHQLRGSAPDDRPQLGRSVDGVPGRLVLHHPVGRGQRMVEVGAERTGLGGHIQVLPAGHLGPHRLGDGQRAGQHRRREPGLLQHLHRPHHQQVAEQDRPGPTEGLGITEPPIGQMQTLELPVRGGVATTGVRAVHHVVVDQRAGVQQLETGGGREHGVERGLVVLRSGGGHVPPRAEGRPQALAAGQQPGGEGEQRAEVGLQVAQRIRLQQEEAADPIVDRRPKRCPQGSARVHQLRDSGGVDHMVSLRRSAQRRR